MIQLKSVKCAAEEQETTITIMRDENKIRLYTSDNTRVTKMQKLINAPDTTWKLVNVDYDADKQPRGYFFECDNKKMLTLKVKKKEATEESRERGRKAAAIMLEKRKNSK